MPRTTSAATTIVDSWRNSVLDRVKDGDRFVGLYGVAEDQSCRLTALIAKAHSYEALDVTLTPNEEGVLDYPALSPDIESAFWYERAVHDLSGVVPTGHPRLDPLLLSVESGSERPRPGRQAPVDQLQQSETPHGPVDVTGRGMFTMAYGPVRSGVFESIEFLIESPGEEIPHLNIRPHFKHRGVAKKFEGKTVTDGVLVAERVEGIASVAHALAFCHAVEQISNITAPPRARLIRVIYAELERIANHLDVATRLTDAAGLAVATARFAWHKETTMRLVSRMCGSRFGRGVVIPGGVNSELLIAPKVIAAELSELRQRIRSDAVLAMHTPSFLDRLRGTGRLDEAYARLWGLVGPLGRASGSNDDLRWSRPTDAYGELPLPDRPAREDDGDVMARLRVRWSEIDTSARIVLAALEQLEGTRPEVVSVRVDLSGTRGRGIGWAEGPQGEMVHALTLEDGLIYRCFARSASFHNLVAFHDAFPADVFTDFAFIEASFGLGYAGVAM
jgi:formate hydrogenlyase subunit 5